jgi:Condensation domain
MAFDPAILVCLQLWRLSPEQHIMLVVQHHSITDGMSLPLLGRDLAAAYTAAVHNQAPQWLPLPAAYVDYAAWQRDLLDGGVLKASDPVLTARSRRLIAAKVPSALNILATLHGLRLHFPFFIAGTAGILAACAGWRSNAAGSPNRPAAARGHDLCRR